MRKHAHAHRHICLSCACVSVCVLSVAVACMHAAQALWAGQMTVVSQYIRPCWQGERRGVLLCVCGVRLCLCLLCREEQQARRDAAPVSRVPCVLLR